MGQPEQDSQNGTARTGQTEQNRQNMTASTGLSGRQLGQDSQRRQPRQDSQPEDVLSPWTFCLKDVLSLRTFCPSGHFVHRSFCPQYDFSQAVLSHDVCPEGHCVSGHVAYIHLNHVTQSMTADRYPLPSLVDLSNKLHGCTYFSGWT
jgi:hypothetical protein